MKESRSQNWRVVAILAGMVALVSLRMLPPGKIQGSVTLLLGAAFLFALCYYTLRVLAARLLDNKPDGECLVAARATSQLFFYLGVAVIAFGVVVVIVYFTNYYGDKNQDLLTGLALACFALGAFGVFFGAFQLKISGGAIEYWSLESGHQSLNLEDIRRAEIRIGVSSRPGVRLEILPRDACKKAIFVALKAFRKTDMDRVFDWLGPKLEDPGKLSSIKKHD